MGVVSRSCMYLCIYVKKESCSAKVPNANVNEGTRVSRTRKILYRISIKVRVAETDEISRQISSDIPRVQFR